MTKLLAYSNILFEMSTGSHIAKYIKISFEQLLPTYVCIKNYGITIASKHDNRLTVQITPMNVCKPMYCKFHLIGGFLF